MARNVPIVARSEPLEKLYCASEIADLLSVSPKTVYKMAKAGSFPKPRKIGGRLLRWRRSDLAKFLEEGSG